MKNACHFSYQAEEDYLLWIPPRCAPWLDWTVFVVPCHPPQGVQPCPTKPHHSIPHWESLSCRCSILRKLSYSCHHHSTTPSFSHLWFSWSLVGYQSYHVTFPVKAQTHVFSSQTGHRQTKWQFSSTPVPWSCDFIGVPYCIWVTSRVADSKAAASLKIVAQEGRQLKSLESSEPLSNSTITWGVLSPGVTYCFCNFGDGVCNSRFIYAPPCRRGCFNEKEMALQQRVTVREYAGIWPLEGMNLGCSFHHVWPLVTVDWSSQEDPVRFFFKAKLLCRF